jgi:hypothetical protein
MIPVYIIAVLGGIGYYLTTEESNRIKTNNGKGMKRKIFREEDLPINDMPSADSLYSQDYKQKVDEDVYSASSRNYEKGHEFIKNNNNDDIVVFPSHQRIKIPTEFQQKDEFVKNSLEPKNDEWTSLSGEKIGKENFIHNNMVPFHSGEPKMVVNDFTSNNTILDLYTGVKRQAPKSETEPFFNLNPNTTEALGRPDEYRDLSRIEPSRFRRNEKPISSEYVAPAFRMGVERVMPKSVDQMRSESNPKVSFEGRAQGPRSSRISKVGIHGKVVRNKPKKYSDYRTPHATSGLNKRPTVRSTQILKDTSRIITRQYAGVAGSTTQWKGYKSNTYNSGDSKHNFGSLGYRNLMSRDVKRHSDYGKSGMMVPQTLRDVINNKNKNKTFTGGLVSLVKKITAPIMDILRTTKKEEFEVNRRAGNVGVIKKNIVYDANDVARTTIKETLIHNNHEGMLKPNGPSGLPAYDPDNIARTTIKETTIVNNRDGVIAPQMASALPAYDPDDVARTTIKETNIHNNYQGQVNLGKRGKKNYTLDKAKTTIRETLPEKETRFLKGMSKEIAFDPNDVARTTIKETTQLTDYLGNGSYNDGRGYLTNPKNPKNTNRIFTTREIKGCYDSSRTGLGYLTNEKVAPNTNRQFTTKEYTGGAAAGDSTRKAMSRANMINAQIFDTKERTLIGRKPTQTGAKVASGASNICLEMKKMQLSKLPNNIKSSSQKIATFDKCSNTNIRNQYGSQINRIDGKLLEPYINNPYSHFINAPKPKR